MTIIYRGPDGSTKRSQVEQRSGDILFLKDGGQVTQGDVLRTDNRGGPGRGQGRKRRFTEETKTVPTLLPDSLHKKLSDKALMQGISPSELIYQLIKDAVDNW